VATTAPIRATAELVLQRTPRAIAACGGCNGRERVASRGRIDDVRNNVASAVHARPYLQAQSDVERIRHRRRFD
jgi:hypothetical protein